MLEEAEQSKKSLKAFTERKKRDATGFEEIRVHHPLEYN